MKQIQPKGYGYYTPERVRDVCSGQAMTQHEDGLWYPVVPEPYYSFWERLRYAWDVLNYRADPLYWIFKTGFKRTPQGFEKSNK